MQVSNAVRTLEKAGFVVRCTRDTLGAEFGVRGRRFVATMPGPYRIEFAGRDADVQCGFRVIHVEDLDEPQSDYHAGASFATCSKAAAYCVKSNSGACAGMGR